MLGGILRPRIAHRVLVSAAAAADSPGVKPASGAELPVSVDI
jgi:hypothetical protein